MFFLTNPSNNWNAFNGQKEGVKAPVIWFKVRSFIVSKIPSYRICCRRRESDIRARGQTNPIHPGPIRTDLVEWIDPFKYALLRCSFFPTRTRLPSSPYQSSYFIPFMLIRMGSVNVVGFREWRVAKRCISERLRRDQVRIPGKCPMRFFLFLLVASARIVTDEDWKLLCVWRPLCRCLWGPPSKRSWSSAFSFLFAR